MRALLLLSFVAVAFASQECGENAHFESCGTACPLTCRNYKNPPKFCILRCDIGCQCDEGYVKTDDGRCVRPEECPESAPEPTECGENAHFESCGTACPLTCENYQNPPKICVLRCDIGCQCDKGYVRAADGRCVRPEQCPATGPIPKEQNCVDEPERGMCLAYFPMWYYDAKAGKCRKFIYGGCQGNGNRYVSEEDCMKKCQGIIAEETETEACDMPAETGVCRGFFPRYYFDRTTGTCQKFVYGGCGGNENNFETIEECQRTCGNAAPSACLQEKVTGPCKAAFPRYYFNKETGECERFIYGGCQGNSNNFMSKEDCESVCKA